MSAVPLDVAKPNRGGSHPAKVSRQTTRSPAPKQSILPAVNRTDSVVDWSIISGGKAHASDIAGLGLDVTSLANDDRGTLSRSRPDPLELRKLWSSKKPPSVEKILERVGKIPTPWGTTLADEYRQDAGVFEGYTLAKHHCMVLKQNRKHFEGISIPGMDRPLLELTLALHDAGKAEAIRNGGTHLQHAYTMKLFDDAREYLPVSDEAFNRMKVLVDGDPLVLLFKGQQTPGEVATQVNAMAHAAGMSPRDFLCLLTAYYQTDASSYTVEAGGKASLEYVFVVEKDGVHLQFDQSKNRLKFNPSNDALYSQLEAALATDERAVDPEQLRGSMFRTIRDVPEFSTVTELADSKGLDVFVCGEAAGNFVHHLRQRLLSKAGNRDFRRSVVGSNDLSSFMDLRSKDLDLAIVRRDEIPMSSEDLHSFEADLCERMPGIRWNVRGSDFLEHDAVDDLTLHLNASEPDLVVRNLNAFVESAQGRIPMRQSRGIQEVMRVLIDVAHCDATISAETLSRIRQVVNDFDPKKISEVDRLWVIQNAGQLAMRSVDLPRTWEILGDLGLRQKLTQLNDDSLTELFNREPLSGARTGTPTGRTAKDLGLDVITHTTSSMATWEAISSTPSSHPNFFLSRKNHGSSEGALYGNGVYTLAGDGTYVYRNEGYPVKLRLDPDAEEGVDFRVVEEPRTTDGTMVEGRYVILQNNAKVRLMDEVHQTLSTREILQDLLDPNILTQPHLRDQYFEFLKRNPPTDDDLKMFHRAASGLLARAEKLGLSTVLDLLGGVEDGPLRKVFQSFPDLSDALIDRLGDEDQPTMTALVARWLPSSKAQQFAVRGFSKFGDSLGRYYAAMMPADLTGVLDETLRKLVLLANEGGGTTLQSYLLGPEQVIARPERLRIFMEEARPDVLKYGLDSLREVLSKNLKSGEYSAAEAVNAQQALDLISEYKRHRFKSSRAITSF